ncbi:DUF5787 family protein [Salarchaeum sp. JOR-1]|uniref:DUF5787 family protein n=1 Tax=Salarchaeum sp. JOR-1 TaxID=2599399 RepID=UPI0011983A76|nr:DUF5787 family protein [Salarchaeum sp. JOR-1]QDX40450.1 hypothetical protein FQU85_05865 [Salarchaeum sp. JOR-1]
MREFAFELRLCAHLEPREGVVSRQLGASVHGTGNRILDVVTVAPGPAFDERVALTPDEIPSGVLDADVGVGRWRRVTDAFDGPPERAHRLAEAGADAGFLELDRKRGQRVARQVARYPDDWFGRLVGIENKPDLGTPGDLDFQLRHDAALGLLDEVVLATESYVTRAHLNRIPEGVGVWRVDFDRDDPIEVVREGTPLDPSAPGVEIRDERGLETRVGFVSPDEKAAKRRRLAERAFGKGWRTYGLPDCAQSRPGREAGAATLPHCAFKQRLVDAASECGPDCPGYEPGDSPAADLDGERAARTAWTPDAGEKRRQASLDRFS